MDLARYLSRVRASDFVRRRCLAADHREAKDRNTVLNLFLRSKLDDKLWCGTVVKLNKCGISDCAQGDQADYMRRHRLRENPLVAYGYLSVGCFPCTQPVKPGEDVRSGRWSGQAKVKCGIHLSGLDASLTDAAL